MSAAAGLGGREGESQMKRIGKKCSSMQGTQLKMHCYSNKLYRPGKSLTFSDKFIHFIVVPQDRLAFSLGRISRGKYAGAGGWSSDGTTTREGAVKRLNTKNGGGADISRAA